jgi:hypothetical protein
MERTNPPVTTEPPLVTYDTSSLATHRRAERKRTYVERPRPEARM